MKITSELFGHYLKCRYKAHLKACGLAGQRSDYDQMREQLRERYKNRGFLNICQAYKLRDIDEPVIVTDRLLREGHPAISDPRIAAEGMEAECDVLERADEESSLGGFYYLPVLFRMAETISKDDRLIMGFAGLALAAMQGKPVEYGKIVCGKDYKTHRIKLKQNMATVKDVIASIRQLVLSGQQPEMILNEHCRVCEYHDPCLVQAKEKDHLSLLRGMSEKEIARVNSRGFFTVTQYAYRFRPRRVKARSKNRPHRFDLQALAIRDKRIYVLEKPALPQAKVSIYLDVEGDPDRNFYYLIGMLVVKDSTIQYYSFWADTQCEEIDIVKGFLEQLGAYDDFRVFHYGAYETKFLKKMKARLNGTHKARVDKAMACAFNVLEVVYPNVYFPTYSNELKEIGRYLGCSWTEENASGLQSLVWRYQWEAHRQEKLKARLIRYNHEDCLALERVVGFLSDLQQSNEKEDKSYPAYAYASNLAGSYPHKQFKKVDFCIPEMEYINRCAYFDYQHDKVSLARSLSKGLGQGAKRGSPTLSERISKTVTLPRPAECPTCRGQKVYANQNCLKTVTDLKFSRRGVKRWTVKYRSKQGRCPACHDTFTNREFKDIRRYGWGLMSWVVYFNVALNLPLNRMLGCLTDLFGISLSRGTLLNFKREVAGYYQPAYLDLVRAVQNSDVIYADETQVKIGRESHYVWVFTNTRDVVFAYSESREGSFLKEFLDGFKAVLVSDFYAAYDSIDCPQQKCLIHLIRDMNDDLLANPFDEEFKELTQAFSILLRAVVETIDRYGLKKLHLEKHKAAVGGFYDNVFKRHYESEAARRYQKRLDKNQDKLFTFLNYDGVSWNNNYAEHAIKHFATYRRGQQGLSTAVSIKQHLVLLSIFQTCKYQNITFLKFLLSKEVGGGRYNAGVGSGERCQRDRRTVQPCLG